MSRQTLTSLLADEIDEYVEGEPSLNRQAAADWLRDTICEGLEGTLNVDLSEEEINLVGEMTADLVDDLAVDAEDIRRSQDEEVRAFDEAKNEAKKGDY